MTNEPQEESRGGEFARLARFTLSGYIAGLLAGIALDAWGYQRSPWGQWLVRTLAGEGESIAEGAFACQQRWRRAGSSLAEAYGWGKVLGLCAPWLVDAISRLCGVDVYAVEGFFIPYLYAMSDQIGASLSGLLYFRGREKSWASALGAYAREPAMAASLTVILLVPAGLWIARIFGFAPTTQVSTALEVIAANLCWIPPLVGWIGERVRGQAPRG